MERTPQECFEKLMNAYSHNYDLTRDVVTEEGGGTFEIKNLAVAPESQRQGYGRAMVEHVVRQCRGRGKRLLVGTGDSPLTLPFYEACGFRECGRIEGFVVENYDTRSMRRGGG